MTRLGSVAANSWGVSHTAVDLVRPIVTPRPVSLPATPQTLTFDLARSAIIVIDMQNDFCHPDGWLASIGVDIAPARAPIEPLAALLPALRRNGVPVIWLNWGNRSDRLNLPPSLLHVYDPAGQGNGLGAALGGEDRHVLEHGSWNAAIVDELSPEPSDIHVAKYRMSGFWDTPLESILRNLRCDTLLFAGVNSDQCVLSTLTDAACIGYDCIMLDDCAATTSPGFCADATRYNVRQCYGAVATGADLITALT
ncbi:cysteine hydrolase family protein [Tanticharoenia sakaeratensis]|uniref:Peroxyureidoacrylate/ureidoacrylate amidohydrolase RutB n=1 Tax=Tanticharoenia sakaeratensis NBRC 103193 TaxID=1231623 RepID=A0A0D6MLP1_9PROT|nr:cysteine hydrolase family protein [Tanticharoenia sakaeratensis]GAN54351.1 peroxyureidoacrylate/ureidoacrylate amidohydrolase RutB [Tanticharoenia sakaeratensis NBRC 103193]GBQ18864.1 isochorismatase hydrolase [Tanticharoenia sakaeratensis NBRC 103193]